MISRSNRTHSHIREALGCDELLQVDGSAPHEAKRRVHGSRTVHLTLVEAAHRVGVVEENTAGIIVEADADSLRERQDAAAVVSSGCGVGRFGNKELAHACCEQSEGLRELIARVLAATVMPAVMVVPGNYGNGISKICYTGTSRLELGESI